MKIIIILSFLYLAIPSSGNSQFLTFTDRASWDAAVSSSFVTEDFNSESFGAFVDRTFSSGLRITGTPDVEITDFAFSSIGEGFAVNKSRNDTASFIFPEGTRAFGFDYADADTPPIGILSIGALNFFLPSTGNADVDYPNTTPDDFGFFGIVIFDPNIFTNETVILTNDAGVIDNVSHSVIPEPSSATLLLLGLAYLFKFRKSSKSAD